MRSRAVQLVLCGLVLALLSAFKIIPNFSPISIVYAYSPQEILNYCYPNSVYSGNTNCDASSVQPGASCTEGAGGPTTESPECGCFGQNTSHTYLVSHIPTQCNDGNGNIQQFQTFQCGQDEGVQWGQCGNPSICYFAQDCEAPAGDGPHSGSQVCSGLTQPNGFCAVDPRVAENCNVCQPKHEASVVPVDANAEYDPQVISQGEPVNVYITATRPCKNATSDPNNPNFNPGSSLVDCKLVQPMTCDLPNPQDWKKCWAEYQCVAANQVGTFHATFSNSDPACTVDDQYTINPPLGCASQQRASASTTSDNVTSTTLGDDKDIDMLIGQGNLPPDANGQLISNAQQEDTQTFNSPNQQRADNSETKVGVEEGIKGNLQSLECSVTKLLSQNSFVKNALVRLGVNPYCPEIVDHANQNTDLMSDEVGFISQSRIPDGAAPNSAQSDCILQDVDRQNGDSVQTQGNKRTNEIDSSSKVIYNEDLPQFSPSPIDITKSPITAEGKVLNDQRVGDVDQNCPLKMQSIFPDGVTRCTDPAPNLVK